MWKQLLASWLSDEWAKVYICSSDIDASRLQEITALAYKVSAYVPRVTMILD